MRTVFLKRTQQVVACLLLLCSGITTSCDDSDNGPDLALDKTTVDVVAGDNATVNITSGSGEYSVTPTSTSVATARIEGSAVKISALAKGTAKFTVLDAKSKQTKTIDVTVAANLALDTPNNVSIAEGTSKDITILSGSGDYSVSVANQAIASATISGSTLSVTALAEGTTTVTVTDNQTDKTVVITIVSEQAPASVYFAASATWDYKIKINAALEDQPNVWIDLNNNGTKEEGEAVTSFNVDIIYPRSAEMTIHGKVTELTFASMRMERIDVTKNKYLKKLILTSQKLETIDLTKNTELTYLDVRGSLLTSIDLSKNTKLQWLCCSSLAYLTTLDVSNNPELEEFYCTSSGMTDINFGNIKKIKRLDAWLNSNLNPFSVTAFTELTYLRIHGNAKFTSFLDLSKNTKLVTLSAGNIDLSAATVDLSKNTALEGIYLGGCKLGNANFLSTLSNPEKIKELQLNNNQFTALNLSRFTALSTLSCQSNKIAETEMFALIASLPTRTVEAPGILNLIDTGRIIAVTEENFYNDASIAAIKAKNWKPYNMNSGGSVISM